MQIKVENEIPGYEIIAYFSASSFLYSSVFLPSLKAQMVHISSHIYSEYLQYENTISGIFLGAEELKEARQLCHTMRRNSTPHCFMELTPLLQL